LFAQGLIFQFKPVAVEMTDESGEVEEAIRVGEEEQAHRREEQGWSGNVERHHRGLSGIFF